MLFGQFEHTASEREREFIIYQYELISIAWFNYILTRLRSFSLSLALFQRYPATCVYVFNYSCILFLFLFWTKFRHSIIQCDLIHLSVLYFETGKLNFNSQRVCVCIYLNRERSASFENEKHKFKFLFFSLIRQICFSTLIILFAVVWIEEKNTNKRDRVCVCI